MMLRYLFLSMCICFFGCKNDSTSPDTSKTTTSQTKKEETKSTAANQIEGFKLRGGVYYEKPTPEALQTKTPYNADNQIFKDGRTFVYDYVMTRKNGQVVICKIIKQKGIPMQKAWTFLPIEERDQDCVSTLDVLVMGGGSPMLKYLSNKKMTFLAFLLQMPSGTAQGIKNLGMVENSQNVWMPNPAGRIFNVLQSAPFLFIQQPYELGHKWNWSTEVPSQYSDPRWGDWQENEKMDFEYEITGKKSLETAFGILECWEVSAKGTGLIGQSSLVTYFHEQYGFVQMTYRNIDESTMVMKLLEIKEPKKKEKQ